MTWPVTWKVHSTQLVPKACTASPFINREGGGVVYYLYNEGKLKIIVGVN